MKMLDRLDWETISFCTGMGILTSCVIISVGIAAGIMQLCGVTL